MRLFLPEHTYSCVACVLPVHHLAANHWDDLVTTLQPVTWWAFENINMIQGFDSGTAAAVATPAGVLTSQTPEAIQNKEVTSGAALFGPSGTWYALAIPQHNFQETNAVPNSEWSSFVEVARPLSRSVCFLPWLFSIYPYVAHDMLQNRLLSVPGLSQTQILSPVPVTLSQR